MPQRIEIECDDPQSAVRLYRALGLLLADSEFMLSMERWENEKPRPVFEPDVVDRIEKLERALNDMGHRLNAAERALAPQH